MAFSMNGRRSTRWTSARLGQVQTSPWFSANIVKPSSALSKKSSSCAMTSAKKMFGDLPPSSSVHRDDVLRGVLHDQAAGRRLAGERDLGDALVRGERLAGFDAEAVDDVEDAGRQKVGDEVHEDHDAHRRLLGGLQHDAVAGGKRRSELPAPPSGSGSSTG